MYITNILCLYVFEQCVIASGDNWICATVRNKNMAENIHNNRHKVGHMKITIINFQKIQDQIKTGFQSTCEIDFEVWLLY